ncbi:MULTISPECIES: HAD-IB family hydrolase [unclassified Acinetobacter]|uniref:HAD-IB family hydrolase n=1 Tax=unclassified Acinetobacter TaxID=196816 RepID=UPI0025785A9A|nr:MULTISPECIES: HAD-IB family hydrolase [unclassified Acinetobacter]MDM1757536.1 HAD-IB family hydrolase [Acinetobacter sp. 256-1]MDM1761549.1 HAD-IB family hydrolase [Acinetobacter sp. 251-1]
MHATRKTYKRLALFDFDGTLCKKDSFTGFIFYALKKRHIVKQGIKILPWIQAYYLNIYPAHSMRNKLFKAMFKDAKASEIQDIAEEYAYQLMGQLDAKIYQQLLEHREQGDHIVLVSASVDIYLEVICHLLDIDLICTQTEIVAGKYTGNYSTLDCSSEQKKLRILEKYDLDQYDKIYAYGNSIEDLEMLSLADYKFMVGEDTQLPSLENKMKLA